MAGLFLVHKSGRVLPDGRTAEAFRNARRVRGGKRSLRLPGEGAVQSALLHGDALVRAANVCCAAVHFAATGAFLVRPYIRRPGHRRWARRVLALVTGAAPALHLAFPLAPPRMLDVAHLVDTGRTYGPTVYGAEPGADPPANQFAAMPDLGSNSAAEATPVPATMPGPGPSSGPDGAVPADGPGPVGARR